MYTFQSVKERDLAVDKIKRLWSMIADNMFFKPSIIVAPFLSIFLFALLVSNNYGNLIAFTTLVISVWFLVIAMWMLVWILKKDCGDKAMLEISDQIKEGSEGFFITQYGTIFRLAFVFAA
jgi:ABC-type phosphate transport system permease subunit